MRWLFLALLISSPLLADDHWVITQAGPFQVYSDAGEKPARERLNELEQFREAFGNTIGKKDLKLVWPLRLLIYKKQTPVPEGQIVLGRDAYMVALPDNSGLTPEMRKQLARLLLADNTSRLPNMIEDGLVALFSTLQVSATHITLGAPPPVSERTRDWARMSLLTTDPAYSGRTRVMLSNLQQSPDMDAACRNAFEKSPADIEKQVDAYMKAGTYATASVSGKAISAAHDFHVLQIEYDASKLAQADLLFAAGNSAPAKTEYSALKLADASEGLGILTLKEGHKDEARRLFASAAQAGSKSARLYLNIGLLETGVAKSRADMRKANELNPNWGEPYRQLANTDPTPALKITDLKRATSLDPRNVEYWQEYAKVATDANEFGDAAKAWSGAERAAPNDQERERIRDVRLQLEGQRADYEAAERKREADEKARELERVKQQSLSEIHAAEDDARKKMNPHGEPPPKATVWMDELNGSARADGILQRFDCLGKQGRLVIDTADGKTVQLLVKDPGQIAITSGEKMMSCGAQKPARHVQVQYIARPDKRLATAGDATVIDFR